MDLKCCIKIKKACALRKLIVKYVVSNKGSVYPLIPGTGTPLSPVTQKP